MSLRFPSSLFLPTAVISAGIVLCLATLAFPQSRELKVCADPDDMPFSNRQQQGFENRIAEIVSKDLDARLVYVWQRMGRGFVREYLDKSQCDVLIGIPSNYRPVLTTNPYYRSSYVFVSRNNAKFKPASLNDPELRGLKIGVQVLDEEYTPPGSALARRGLQDDIVGFDTTADAESIVRAVANGQVDTAIVWGPQAGYFAQKYHDKILLTPVSPEVDPPGVPFTFAISMGVRKGNTQLRDDLERILTREQITIRGILKEYAVPQLELAPAGIGG